MTSPAHPGGPGDRAPAPYTFDSRPAPPDRNASGRGSGAWLIGGAVVVALGLVLGAILWIAHSATGGGPGQDLRGTGETTDTETPNQASSTGDDTDSYGAVAAAEDSALNFVNAMIGRSGEPMEHFVCREYRDNYDFDELREAAQDVPELAFIDDVRVHRSYYEGDDIHVVIALKSGDEIETTDPMVMVEEDGEWLVCGGD